MTDGDGILRMDISDDAYPHDRVRGHHYHQSGGQSRTAYIISQRREIEKLRAAGVDVDADIKEAALKLFIRKSVADPYYHHHDRAGLLITKRSRTAADGKARCNSSNGPRRDRTSNEAPCEDLMKDRPRTSPKVF